MPNAVGLPDSVIEAVADATRRKAGYDFGSPRPADEGHVCSCSGACGNDCTCNGGCAAGSRTPGNG